MSRSTRPFIPFALPSLGAEEEQALVAVLRSHWLTTGEVTRRFESEFAAAVGASHALAVSSATAGLHLALEAAGVREGDLVITTPFTFTATAEVIRYLGAHPLFVDIREDTFTISPDGVETALRQPDRRNRVSAVMPVHFGGLVCDIERIVAAARQAGASVVEDAAHAFTSASNGRPAGTFGSVGVFSFYATKTITTGEGGMVVTDKPEIARRMSIMRLHGIDRDMWDRYTSPRAAWEYQVLEAGYKYNMTDMAAALGRVQLRKAQALRTRRARIAERYLEAFSQVDYLILPYTPVDGHSWHLFTLRIVPDKLRITRNEYVQELMERGIGTSVHYIPLHIMPYYRRLYDYKPEDYPNSMRVFESIFSIPIYPDLTEEQVERIISTVLDVGARNYTG